MRGSNVSSDQIVPRGFFDPCFFQGEILIHLVKNEILVQEKFDFKLMKLYFTINESKCL